MLDRVFQYLYDQFVIDGGLDQTSRIVDEDFERMERQAVFCAHGDNRRRCPFCTPTSRTAGQRSDEYR